ncbi:unnamed protein product [Camellia sinensis]
MKMVLLSCCPVITILLAFFYQPLATAVTYNQVFPECMGRSLCLCKPYNNLCPKGRYLLHKAKFYSEQCKNTAITIRIDGTLVAPSDYRAIGNGGSWLIFEKVSGVSIFGGTLDGQGTGLWVCKASGKACPTGATDTYVLEGLRVDSWRSGDSIAWTYRAFI